MGDEITKTTAVPSDIKTVPLTVPEDMVSNVEEYLEQEYCVELSPVTDASGSVILVDPDGIEFAEIQPDGTVTMCEEPSEEKSLEDMTPEELAEYIRGLIYDNQYEDTQPDASTSNANSAAKFADTSDKYTDPIFPDPIDENVKVDDPVDKSSDVDDKSSPSKDADIPESKPEKGKGGTGGSTEPEGVITGTSAPSEAPEIKIPIAGMLPGSDVVGRAYESASKAAGGAQQIVRADGTKVKASASENNVPGIVVAGAKKAVGLEDDAKKGAAPHGSASTTSGSAHGTVVASAEVASEPEKVADKKSSSVKDGDVAKAAKKKKKGTSHVSSAVVPSAKHASMSDPFTAGGKVVYDKNSDVFFVTSDAANKGAPPVYNFAQSFVPVSVALNDSHSHHVAPAHHRGDQGGRQGHDGDESNKGNGGQDRDSDSDDDEGNGVSAIA